MKTKSLKVGSAKTGSTRPSFSDLKEIFVGGDNHEENSKGAEVSGKQNSKDTSSMVAKNNPPSVPSPNVNYSPYKKPEIKGFDTQTGENSRKEVNSISKSTNSQLPDSSISQVTGKSKEIFNQTAPGPQKEFGDKISDGIVAKNNSIYDSNPNAKNLESNSNKTQESLTSFDQGKMKEGYLNQTGEIGKGNFKEGSESNMKYGDQFDLAKESTSPNKAGTEMDKVASIDINPNAKPNGNLSKDGTIDGVLNPGSEATSKSAVLKSEMSSKTTANVISPVNEGIISQKSVIFGYFKL
jgi:hypothetical protein